MKLNMGGADRVIRILIALVIGILYLTHAITGTWAYVLLAVAGVFLLTSLVGLCPLYSLFGMNTCKTKKV
jgi:hypothetical protein